MPRYADLSYIAPEHRPLDLRLHNWARWARVHGARFTQPMFRLYRPEQNEAGGYSHSGAIPVDSGDAMKIEKGVVKLPDGNKWAIYWAYRSGVRPVVACKALHVSRDGLATLIHDGRMMLVSRGV